MHVDIFPLTDKAGIALRTGAVCRRDPTIEDILPASENERANYIYLATIYASYRNGILRAHPEQIGAGLIPKRYPPRADRLYLAIPYSREGENLLRTNGFILETNRHINCACADVFVLDAEGARCAAKRLLHKIFHIRTRARMRSAVRTRKRAYIGSALSRRLTNFRGDLLRNFPAALAYDALRETA